MLSSSRDNTERTTSNVSSSYAIKKNTSTAARRRHLDFMRLCNEERFIVHTNDTVFEFWIELEGPEDTSYEGGLYILHVILPTEYPFKSPSIAFANPIFHPNIDEQNGTVCLDVINQTWTPLYDLTNIFDTFIPQLLRYPNPTDPLNIEAASLLICNSIAYTAKVAQHVCINATFNKAKISLLSSGVANINARSRLHSLEIEKEDIPLQLMSATMLESALRGDGGLGMKKTRLRLQRGQAALRQKVMVTMKEREEVTQRFAKEIHAQASAASEGKNYQGSTCARFKEGSVRDDIYANQHGDIIDIDREEIEEESDMMSSPYSTSSLNGKQNWEQDSSESLSLNKNGKQNDTHKSNHSQNADNTEDQYEPDEIDI